MINRILSHDLKRLATQFPVIGILGPRQSGKTTLAQKTFPNHKYILFEEILSAQEFAKQDPHGFFELHKNDHGIILDEFQHVPSILSYIQMYADRENKPGYFVLTSSQNFLMNQAISQTLAGRIAILTLLPFSIEELKSAGKLPDDLETLVFQGSYPRIHARGISPLDWYPNYIVTYLERDVRDIKKVVDLSLFKKFVQFCAGRVGQILNYSSLAADCSIDVATVKSWLSILEASYIIFLLQPHHKNFSKRLIKSPKIYFYDTGLACSLLGIDSPHDLATHYARGNLFESLILSEIHKHYFNIARLPHVYFWRDQSGNEIDCIIEKGEKLTPLEIKSGKTINQSFFDGISYWKTLAKAPESAGFLIYGGQENQKRSNCTVLGWQSVEEAFKDKHL